jgi:hypothetical protein
MTEPEVLEALYDKLVEACNAMKCGCKMLSALPFGTQTFVLSKDGKSMSVELRSDQAGFIRADLGFNRDSLDLAQEQFNEIVSREFAEKSR